MRSARLVLLALALLLVASGCDSDAYRIANGFVKKWTGATIRQTLRYTLGIPTGNSLIDDMVDSQHAADDMAVADKLYQAALKDNDRNLLSQAADITDQAIALRPTDWRYRITRASIAIQQGDAQTMDFHLTEARAEGKDQTTPEAQQELREIRDAKIAEFEKLAARLRFHNRGPCESFYLELRNDYENRANQTGAQSDRDAAARYDGVYQQCATLPR